MATRQTVTAEVKTLAGSALSIQGVRPVSEYLAISLRDLNRYRPYRVRTTLTGDGTDEYALGANWSAGFSTISRVRYLADGDFDATSEILPTESYDATEVTSAGAPQIRFSFSPSASAKVIIEHTARHSLTESASTTTLNDDEAGALAYLTAATLLRSAASTVGATVPQGTDEDFASGAFGGGGTDAFRRLADDYDKAADGLLGIDRSGASELPPAAPAFVSVPATPNARNASYLTHPRRGAEWRR